MTYQCRDCSYSQGQFPHGRCPACDSFNITSADKPARTEGSASSKRWRLIALLALWSVLLYLLYQKL